MFDFLKRRRLLKRGLASKKQRRRRTRNELLHSLEYAVFVKIVILAAFIAGLAFLIFTSDQLEPTKSFVIALLFFATAVAALWINHPKSFSQNSRVFLVFGVGPAGTGKTYLAVAMAVAALKREQVSRIILTRPAVEAGEALGFLPGDLQEKITPYLRPLYDALRDMLDPEEIERSVARLTIEVAPLAYMRGRTLSNAFVILDEAQNTTTEQMFMLLTRIGLKSKCVVTGDVTQIDLPSNKRSGLVEALQALKAVPGIGFVYFTERDVVRHELVRAVINAYQQHRSPANISGNSARK